MPSPALPPPAVPSAPATQSTPGTPAAPAFRRWAIAVTVYVSAVFNRTSLGVAGLDAAHRFRITPGQLSVFVLAQLGVYAAMQVPTGLLVDRFGPRRLLITAACTMALAQLAFAFAWSYPGALLARAVLGCGDALTFVSVIRFAAQDFAPRRFPLAVSVTSMLGMAGNVIATIPLTLLLHAAGWTPSFAGMGLISLVTGAAVWALLPADPTAGGTAHRRPLSRRLLSRRLLSRRLLSGLRVGGPKLSGWLAAARRVSGRAHTAWRTPGTRLGFWVHFSCMSLTTMFSVLWGLPYLVAQGFSLAGASAVLLVCVLAAIALSPAVGMVFGRFPAARVPFAAGVCLVTVAGWAVLLGGFGGRPPHALIVVVVALMAAGGPASTIGFSLARDYNARTAVGTASGVVNVGGFSAAILASLLVGAILDLAGRSDVPAYRLAFGCAVAVQLAGTVMTVRWWLRVRGLLLSAQSRGEPVPVRVVRRQFDRVHATPPQAHATPPQAHATPAHAQPVPPGPRARRTDGDNAERVSAPGARGAVSAARRVGYIASTRSRPLDARKPASGLDSGATTRRSMW